MKIVSYLAPNWFYLYEAVSQSLGRALGIETSIQQGAVDPLDDPMLQTGDWDMAFICGLPLVRLNHQSGLYQPISAPVMQGTRYQNLPTYFADVIVHRESQVDRFNALRGKTFCYNDSGSNSGYFLLYHYLRQEQKPSSFFKQTLQSGSHETSIRWVAEGLADCAAIDSIVLEQELQNYPELGAQLRVIQSIGPSPMPPLAGANRLEPDVIFQIRHLLLHPDPQLQIAMDRAQVIRYASVDWDSYAAIAQALQQMNALL
jgi:phosphonate transport system substrate-binding protein